MTDIKAMVLKILKTYPYKKRQIEQLRFELEHPPLIGEKELIDSLSLGVNPQGEGVRYKGHISNKTMAIALRYQDVMQQLNSESISEIMRELRSLEAETTRLEHYISLLDEPKAKVIALLYFEQKTWNEAENEMNISKRTLSNYRKSALNELAIMYSYLGQVRGKESGDTA